MQMVLNIIHLLKQITLQINLIQFLHIYLMVNLNIIMILSI